jgi:5'-nucleotidase
MTIATPKFTVLLDQDGVLAQWQPYFERKLAERYPHIQRIDAPHYDYYIHTHYSPEYREYIQDIMDLEGFYTNLDPMPGAIEAVHEMEAEGLDIAICTSPFLTNFGCASEKYDWVKTHLGASWADRTILTMDKTRVVGDLIIDDKPTITGNAEPTWKHVVFDAFYNQLTLMVRSSRVWTTGRTGAKLSCLRLRSSTPTSPDDYK